MHGSLEELFAADDAKRDVMGSDEAREGGRRECVKRLWASSSSSSVIVVGKRQWTTTTPQKKEFGDPLDARAEN